MCSLEAEECDLFNFERFIKRKKKETTIQTYTFTLEMYTWIIT